MHLFAVICLFLVVSSESSSLPLGQKRDQQLRILSTELTARIADISELAVRLHAQLSNREVIGTIDPGRVKSLIETYAGMKSGSSGIMQRVVTLSNSFGESYEQMESSAKWFLSFGITARELLQESTCALDGVEALIEVRSAMKSLMKAIGTLNDELSVFYKLLVKQESMIRKSLKTDPVESQKVLRGSIQQYLGFVNTVIAKSLEFLSRVEPLDDEMKVDIGEVLEETMRRLRQLRIRCKGEFVVLNVDEYVDDLAEFADELLGLIVRIEFIGDMAVKDQCVQVTNLWHSMVQRGLSLIGAYYETPDRSTTTTTPVPRSPASSEPKLTKKQKKSLKKREERNSLSFVGEFEAVSEEVEAPVQAELNVIPKGDENDDCNEDWLEPFKEISRKRWNRRNEDQPNSSSVLGRDDELAAYRDLLDSSFPALDRSTLDTRTNSSRKNWRMRKRKPEILPEIIQEVPEQVEEVKSSESNLIKEADGNMGQVASASGEIEEVGASCDDPVRDKSLVAEFFIEKKNGEVAMEAGEEKSESELNPSSDDVYDGNIMIEGVFEEPPFYPPMVEPIYRAASELKVQEIHRLTSQALACIQLAEFKCDEVKLISMDTLTSYNADIMKARIVYCLAMLEDLEKSAADFENQAAAMPNLERINF
jgi:hypothetical protein